MRRGPALPAPSFYLFALMSSRICSSVSAKAIFCRSSVCSSFVISFRSPGDSISAPYYGYLYHILFAHIVKP